MTDRFQSALGDRRGVTAGQRAAARDVVAGRARALTDADAPAAVDAWGHVQADRLLRDFAPLLSLPVARALAKDALLDPSP